MSTVNIQQKNNNPSLTQQAAGVAAASGSGYIARKGVMHLARPYFSTVFDNIDNFSPTEFDILTTESNRMIDESGIKKKGFKGVVWFDSHIPNKSSDNTGFNFRDEIIDKLSNPSKKNKPFSQIIMDRLNKLDPPDFDYKTKVSTVEAFNMAECGLLKKLINGSVAEKASIAMGYLTIPLSIISNALTGVFPKKPGKRIGDIFMPISNRIYAQKPSALLHEIGHSINYNKNFITKLPKRMLNLSNFILIPLAISTAILTKKKDNLNNENKKPSILEKTKQNIHNHIGSIVTALSLPLLTEEGMASLRAIKFVNSSKLIDKATKNRHAKALAGAFGTYLISTAVLASTASLGVFVKDKICDINLDKKK